jgi:hypothetical protein
MYEEDEFEEYEEERFYDDDPTVDERVDEMIMARLDAISDYTYVGVDDKGNKYLWSPSTDRIKEEYATGGNTSGGYIRHGLSVKESAIEYFKENCINEDLDENLKKVGLI